MMRVTALKAANGYREDVIAAEEDELCVRLRAMNWRIWRLPDEMGYHDAAMLRFEQWWRRSTRAGYAFAQGSDLHGRSLERHFVRETRRAWGWGMFLPLACLAAALAYFPYGVVVLLIYPLQFARLVWRNQGTVRERLRLALFQLLGRFPEAWGVFRFHRDKWLGRRPRIIEYKAAGEAS